MKKQKKNQTKLALSYKNLNSSWIEKRQTESGKQRDNGEQLRKAAVIITDVVQDEHLITSTSHEDGK